MGQDAKAASLQELYAWDSCLFQGLVTNETLPVSAFVAELAINLFQIGVFSFPSDFPFSLSLTHPSVSSSFCFSAQVGIIVQTLIRVKAALWHDICQGQGCVGFCVSNQQLFLESWI